MFSYYLRVLINFEGKKLDYNDLFMPSAHADFIFLPISHVPILILIPES
jgi:hypothetical protein